MGEAMAGVGNYSLIIRHIERGDRVKFLQDFYGALYAETVPGWKFWQRKRRVRLSTEEVARLKGLLKDARSN